MKAVIFEAPGRARVTMAPEPVLRPGHVVVKIEASGLCATDRDIINGHTPVTAPRILGHQGAGTIAFLGAGASSFRVGDRVVISIDVPCDDCPRCKEGRTNICPSLRRIGFELDGTHADYVVVPEKNLVKLPDAIPFALGCILADAVASVYHALVIRAKLTAGERVVLLGIGGVSIHGVQIARLWEAEVLVTSRQPARLQKALEHGAARAVNPETEDLKKAVFDFTRGQGADVVLDSIGLESSIQEAVDMLRPGGRVVAFGNIQPGFSLRFMDLFLKEKEILGARANTKEDLVAVTALAASGKVKPIVSRNFPLSDFDLAIREIESNSLVGRAVFDL